MHFPTLNLGERNVQITQKVLHISHTDIRYDSRIQKEILSLAETNFLEVFTIGISNKNKFEKDYSKKGITNFSIKLLTRNISSIRSFRYTLNLLELFFKILKIGLKIKPKVIHCHDTLVLLPSVLLKILLKSKLIYDAHELESNKNMQTFLLSKSTLFIEKICWQHIDILISVSNSIINWYLVEFGYKKNLLILNTPILKNNSLRIKANNNLRRIHKNYNSLECLKGENLNHIFRESNKILRSIEESISGIGYDETLTY